MRKRSKKTKGASAVTTKPEVPAAPSVGVKEMTGPIPPEFVRQMAMEEGERNLVRQYLESVYVLREKGFSYREIAEWLTERGVEVDHNEVYREFMKYCERGKEHGMRGMVEEELERQEQEGE
jgi:hypothetical protein